MRRVGAYVASYGARASVVVATERYTQQTTGNTSSPHARRVIAAEFAIVKVDTITGWIGFRDVIEVDGQALPDRENRLIRSLTGGDAGYDEARRLSDESARFNIGTIERNFNVPTTTLFYFAPQNHGRFKFAGLDVSADGTWRIGWRETEKPTLIRTPEGTSVPSEGELWVRPADGTIVRVLLRNQLFGDRRHQQQHMNGQVDVTYKYVEPLGMWLPDRMIEDFEIRGPNGAWERTEGEAVYSNYRQFTTSVRVR
jgi:hypothetical protein